MIDSTGGRASPKGKSASCCQEEDGVEEGRAHRCVWQTSEMFGEWKYMQMSSTKKKGSSLWEPGRGSGEAPREAVSVYALCFLTGTENVRNGNHEAAFSYFQKAAERGYSKAQYNEGLCHEYGRGTSRDLGKVPTSSPVPRPIPCATGPE